MKRNGLCLRTCSCSCHEGSSGHLPPGSLGLFLKRSSVLIWSPKFPFGIENHQFSSASLAPLTYSCWFFFLRIRGERSGKQPLLLTKLPGPTSLLQHQQRHWICQVSTCLCHLSPGRTQRRSSGSLVLPGSAVVGEVSKILGWEKGLQPGSGWVWSPQGWGNVGLDVIQAYL